MSNLLDSTKAPLKLDEQIVKGYPALAKMLEFQRPRTRNTVTEMLNSTLLTKDGKGLRGSLEDHENDPKIQKLLQKAYTDKANGIESKETEFLNAIRRKVVDIGMWANPGWLTFFDFVRLADDEHPQIQQDFENEFEVIVLGQEGGVESRRYVRENMSFRDINMEFRSTPETVYTLLNPDTGAYQLNKPMMNELERSHRYQLNELSGAAIFAAIGNFPTVAGGQSFLLHNANLPFSSFKNVPTTNDIDLESEGGITKEVFINIIDYADRMPGFGVDNDFRQIKSILVPSIDRKQLNRFISVSSGFDAAPNVAPQATFSPEFQSFLEQNGFPSQMFGNSFTLVVDKTLAANALYVSFNQAAGTIWEKPGMTMVVDRVEPEKNRGIIRLHKVYQVTIEPHQRPNVLKVRYNT